MKIIYCCYGGAHTSVTCASIHLGFLPQDRVPAVEEFYAVPFYDKMEHKQVGTPLYVGSDEFNNDIYVMGLAGARIIAIRSIYSMMASFDLPWRELILVNALVKLHPITSIGGYASRRLHLIHFGRPLTVWGIRKCYPLFVDLVKRVKKDIASKNEFS